MCMHVDILYMCMHVDILYMCMHVDILYMCMHVYILYMCMHVDILDGGQLFGWGDGRKGQLGLGGKELLVHRQPKFSENQAFTTVTLSLVPRHYTIEER